jgi:hypothetical protein
MFVNDTTDAVYPPEVYDPEAIMDRLSEILSENVDTAHSPMSLGAEWTGSPTGLRRPHLTGIKSLTSLHQLQPFFSRASIDTYEGVYGDVGVDWDAVEEGLEEEIFTT